MIDDGSDVAYALADVGNFAIAPGLTTQKPFVQDVGTCSGR